MSVLRSALCKARTEVRVATSASLGRHLVATRPYCQGDVIGEEDVAVWTAPAGFVVSTALVGMHVDRFASTVPWLDALHGHVRPSDDHVSLFDAVPETQARLCKWMTNAVQVNAGCLDATALSVLVALSTHACQPNADYAVARWGVKHGVHTPRLRLVATRPIDAGEPITVRYAACADLPEAYGFSCGCRRDTEPDCQDAMSCIRQLYNDACDIAVRECDTTVLAVHE